jgi:hypothetical protein
MRGPQKADGTGEIPRLAEDGPTMRMDIHANGLVIEEQSDLRARNGCQEPVEGQPNFPASRPADAGSGNEMSISL